MSHYVTRHSSLLVCTELSHAYVSFSLVSCMTPLHCYAHAPLSFAAIDANSCATYSLPSCASTYAFPATDVYFYDTYDVFFP